jgi:hypothetical protein
MSYPSLCFFDTDAPIPRSEARWWCVRHKSVRYSLLRYAMLTGNDNLQAMHKKDGVKALL